MLEDGDEAAVTAVTARNPEDDSIASWTVELSLFLREPIAPLSSKAARGLERVSLTLECEFAPHDVGIYPSRGAAGVRGSRFFVDEGAGGEVNGEKGKFSCTRFNSYHEKIKISIPLKIQTIHKYSFLIVINVLIILSWFTATHRTRI